MVTYKGKIREKPKDLEEATAIFTNFDAEQNVIWGFQIDFAMGKESVLTSHKGGAWCHSW